MPKNKNSGFKSINEKQSYVKFSIIETVSYGLLIGSAVGLVFYLFHSEPVSYTIYLISEDHWGEYFTSISYGLSSVLLIALLFKPARRAQKVVWAIIGSAAFIIGAEEINWGQNIFNISTPAALSEVNVQNQINFHNLYSFHYLSYHAIAAYMVLGWSIFSVAVSLWFPRLKNSVQTLGLPLIPIQIVLIFLTVPYFFLVSPVPKSDEIGELFLSIAVLVWASDMFVQYSCIKSIRGIWTVISIFGILLFTAALSAGMTYRFPSSPGWRLNVMALRGYPSFGMYDQAESIYEYIYTHPEYLTPETRINHARMLLELGNKNKAFKILTKAVEHFETNDPTEKQSSSGLKNFGIVLRLLGHSVQADDKFNQAIQVDEQKIESISNQEDKAELLWSIAKTLEARGDISAAIDKAHQASSMTDSVQFHNRIVRWIEELTERHNSL